jgi:hypothetical protein
VNPCRLPTMPLCPTVRPAPQKNPHLSSRGFPAILPVIAILPVGAVLLMSAMLTGCGAQGEAEGSLAIRVSIAPTPPIVGPARILVTVTDPVLGPMEEGEVWIEGSPADSGAGSAGAAAGRLAERLSAERLGEGMFAVPAFPFTTPGDWILQIHVRAGGMAEPEQTVRHEVRVVGGGPPRGGN